MKVLVTGCAGFIGFHVAKRLTENGHDVLGIDCMNEYYDVSLKKARLKELGIAKSDGEKKLQSGSYLNFSFANLDLTNAEELKSFFSKHQFDTVCNLAAQAGVRYSIVNPAVYVENNIKGFFNLLDCVSHSQVKLFLYASSSSVYGNSKEMPFRIQSETSKPVSFYAATKKANELMAYTYSDLYKLKTIGIRLFTVYGPWGRPDMAYFDFTNKILKGDPILLYNHGQLQRDFTFIDDIVNGFVKIIESEGKFTTENYKIYNLGNHDPVTLERFVKAIETAIGKKAVINFLPMQPGDVESTYADISESRKDFQFEPLISIETGIKKFVDWYRNYYKI
jgi:UDP-glucuronate 4-epimerase